MQSSAYGICCPLVFGVSRIAGNLVWYADFAATANTTDTSGKGGGSSSTTFTYTASVIMGICEGQIANISRIWKNKLVYAGTLSTSTEGYTVPSIGGTFTVSNVAAYSANISVVATTGLGAVRTLRENIDYFRTGAVYTFPAPTAGWTMAVTYQYVINGSASPIQLPILTETYTIPPGGGTYTVAQAGSFASNISVTDGGVPSMEQWYSEGANYTRVGGTYTFPADMYGTVFITYQYKTGGVTLTAMQQLGLSFATGALGQATWPYLTTAHPTQALGYSGLALVYAQGYALNTSASIDNHSFEVQGPQAYSISPDIADANPQIVAYDVLINGRYGAAFASTYLGAGDKWSTYCLANGLFVSPSIDTQMQAGEFLTLMCKITNTAPVWSGGTLKMVPYGDTPATANGATYAPNVTPIYDLGDDDYIGGSDPILVTRLPQADAYNHIRVEFLNRSSSYNVEIAEAKDSANIDIYGLRSADILTAHWICDAAIARNVAQLLLQRTLYVRNTYAFTLPWTKALLEPMDLVTLSDAALGFVKVPVRITEVSESAAGDLAIIAEEFPLGVATAALYASQVGAGYQHNYNAPPGSAQPPLIFEAPGALTQNGLELYVAATGLGANWGGCNVWMSLDGTSYKQAGTLNGGSRYGVLTNAPTAGSDIAVQLLTGTLASGSAADSAALNTLCFIAGTSPEYFAYQTATLTALRAYDLSGAMQRGAYGTTDAAHAIGAGFARVDTSLFKTGPIDLVYVGKTIHVKLTSFNIYGANEEDISTVTDYTYTITGVQVLGNAGAAAFAGIISVSSDNSLTPGEKGPVIQDVANLLAEQAGIDSEASAYGVAHAAYDTAITNLTGYLASLTTPTLWSNVAGNTDIVGPIFRSYFEAAYATRQAVFNGIAAAAGTVATWNGVSGSGKPSDNASADLNLVVTSGAPTIVGNSVLGIGTFQSADLYLNGAYVSFVVAAPTVPPTASGSNFIMGLSTSGGAGFANINFGIHPSQNGGLYRYNNAVATLIFASWAIGDVLAVTYDGSTVRYLQNGNVRDSVAFTTTNPMLLNAAFYSATDHATNIRFGPLTDISGALAAAATAEAAAVAAAASAATANSLLANIASDAILSPSEKPAVVQDYAVITSEQAGIDAQATAIGFATACPAAQATYHAAVAALPAYLGGLTGWNVIPGGDVPIVGATFRANFAAVYTAKQALLDQIAATAATLAAWNGITGIAVTTGQIVVGAATDTFSVPVAGPIGVGITSANTAGNVIASQNVGPYSINCTVNLHATFTAVVTPTASVGFQLAIWLDVGGTSSPHWFTGVVPGGAGATSLSMTVSFSFAYTAGAGVLAAELRAGGGWPSGTLPAPSGSVKDVVFIVEVIKR